MSKNGHTAFVPNKRLKQARLQRGWTQADLAGFLGTDGYTVNRWERGRAHPRLHFHRKLCDLFDTDAFDLGLFSAPPEDLDTSLSLPARTPSAFWSVPLARNHYFTGREEILNTLDTLLVPSCSGAPVQNIYVLQGLGGIGKTQIALEYAYLHARQYHAVFWIDAETDGNIIASMQRIAEVLQISGWDDTNQQHIVVAVQRWLSRHHPWLLIWDNLEDPEVLQRFLPPVHQGTVLITTRCQALGTLAEGVDLRPMERDEGILFVLRRARLLKPGATSEQAQLLASNKPAEYAAAEELVMTMGGLPLALDQAGAYLEETGCSLADYLRCYRQQRTDLLQRRGLRGSDHPHSVATTFRLACKRVEQELAATADLLRVCSLLHAEAIPEKLFLEGAVHLGPVLAPLAADPVQFDYALVALRDVSLIRRDAKTHTFSLHHLVLTVVWEGMSEQERAMWRERIIAALNMVFPTAISDTWEQCQRLLSHILTIAAARPVEQNYSSCPSESCV